MPASRPGMPAPAPPASPLKQQVRDHWEDETCGVRYGTGPEDRLAWFRTIREARYRLEPYILPFADFPSGADRDVLEIGVGAGSDFYGWVSHGARATGVDLTEAGVELTREHLGLEGLEPDRWSVRRADAEDLPFDDASFDLVYSWGVLHHTPDTARAFAEARRVLRPGGELRAMIYHVPSWSGWMLQVQHGILKGRPGLGAREAIYEHLESPGTKAYTVPEARELVRGAGFREVEAWPHLGTSDLLAQERSARYRSGVFRVVWALYPRWLVRRLGHRFGLCLLVRARA